MKLIPRNNNLVIKIPPKSLEKQTKSWIIAYNPEPPQNEEVVVLSVGKDVRDVKEGDKVCFIRHWRQRGLDFEDHSLAICKESEIIWIFN